MFATLLTITPCNHDSLTLRRARVLAGLFLFMVLMSGLNLLSVLSWKPTLGMILLNVGLLAGYGVGYVLNRRGHVHVATFAFVALLAIQPIVWAIANHSPVPSIFFLGVAVVIAAAFGQPRRTLICAAVLSGVPFALNILLYGSVLASMESVTLADGTYVPPMLVLEILAILILWMLGGTAYLATRLLYQAIEEGQVLATRAEAAQQAQQSQQTDLEQRNAELTQTQRRLETLVTALAVPVVPIADNIGLVPLVGPLDAARMLDVERTTLSVAADQRLRALVVDLSGATEIDSTSVGAIVRLCQALRLLGVTALIAGIRAQDALLLAQLGIALPQTAATVQQALALLTQPTPHARGLRSHS